MKIGTFVLSFILFVTLGCKETPKQEIKTESIGFKKEGELQIYQSDSLLVDLDIELAETAYEIQTGLMYRSSMEKKQGMLFIFDAPEPRSFYMKNTEIPLDIIYISDSLRIVSFQKNAKPLDEKGLPSKQAAQYVLEINGGLSDLWNLQIGDSISYSKN
ncbi:Hypothetical protein I595_3127 [Croceitalea dokdonensis DOKDO 023]|uniref:DUF192 domain-containing protein n=1 Tax=Croceitalea dokdonensis DOKDO 023 TaxID=1300341 RepID=A0A0P7ABS9_9FLAO|nr:DUF192 domain-containing protein [Croceitalea dokdonensis]KPM30633.1 Hypothetical protein I595_3127 [Croceitalea dokdonensis DOKDO 023]